MSAKRIVSTLSAVTSFVILLSPITAQESESMRNAVALKEAGVGNGGDAPAGCICPIPAAACLEIFDETGGEYTFMTKVRALPVFIVDPTPQAIRVTFQDLNAPYDVANGMQMWVGEPFVVCENAGQSIVDDPDACAVVQAPLSLTTTYARLQCQPLYRNWVDDGVINFIDEWVIPESTYRVDTIAESCPLECPFSELLEITTPIWGDVTAGCHEVPCVPPDNRVDITTDVTAVLSKFAKARSDNEPSKIDFHINMVDVVFVLDAFSGESYPFEPPGPAPCTGN